RALHSFPTRRSSDLTCERVTGVDSSRPALEAAEQNANLNGREIEWIQANAFDLLRDYSDSGQKYDSIILDPPAFAKSKRELQTRSEEHTSELQSLRH